MRALSPAQRVVNVLTGRGTDRVPFTAYENKVQYGRAERELRNHGLCIVQRKPDCITVDTPNCASWTEHRNHGDKLTIRTVVETTEGQLEAVDVDRGGGIRWHERLMFRSEKDYAPLSHYLRDLTYVPDHHAVEAAMQLESHDLFYRGQLGYSPMHDIIYTYMGIERFSYEWADNRDRVLRLYEILCEKYIESCEAAKGSPHLAINICGNVTTSVVSPQMFRDYYVPMYQEACRILHSGRHLCGVHFDGNTAGLAELIAGTDLDYIEALTPPPVGDVTVRQARAYWPDKALWINFPSSVHLESDERVRATARELLEESRGMDRFIMGITEDVPPTEWPRTYRIILDECNRFG